MKYPIITINFNDEPFPTAFKVIGKDCPQCIYVMGNFELLQREKFVTIIGARKSSCLGNEKAYALAVDYARKGHVVVSGLALGCDAAAHRGCLAAGGKTIAIVATGLDLVHPKENASLQEEILQKGGLIISEYPLRTKANPTRLIARNRLQAALSDCVIVAECAEHSGTMHTVRFAQKYNKTIKAVKYVYENAYNSGNCLIIQKGIGGIAE